VGGDCIGDSVDPDEPKVPFGSSGSTESPIQSLIDLWNANTSMKGVVQ
jgi:hypothetical protein